MPRFLASKWRLCLVVRLKIPCLLRTRIDVVWVRNKTYEPHHYQLMNLRLKDVWLAKK